MFSRIVCLGIMLAMCFGILAGCGEENEGMADYVSVCIKEEFYEDFFAEQLQFDLDDEIVIYNKDNYFATPYTVDIFLKDINKNNNMHKNTKKIMSHLKSLDFVLSGKRLAYSLERVHIKIRPEFREEFLADGFVIDDFEMENIEKLQYNLNDWQSRQSVDICLKKTGRSFIFEAIQHLEKLEFIECALPSTCLPNMGNGYPEDDFYKGEE